MIVPTSSYIMATLSPWLAWTSSGGGEGRGGGGEKKGAAVDGPSVCGQSHCRLRD